MFKKGSKLYSISQGKCPKCHEGKFFRYPFTFNPSKITSIHDKCSHCGQKYMLEPSFFYGAMYINYAITVAIGVTVFVISAVFLNVDMLSSFLWVIIALLITAPINMRLARILWINMFVHYDPNSSEKKNV